MLNKVQLIGRLGKDPEVRNLDNGACVASFSVATTDSWKDKATGEKKEATEWHNIVLWRGLAEIAQKYLHKGDLVFIEGKSVTRKWEKDGVTRYTTEVIGNEMKMLGGKKDSNRDADHSQDPGNRDKRNESTGGKQATNYENYDGAGAVDNSTDDLPF